MLTFLEYSVSKKRPERFDRAVTVMLKRKQSVRLESKQAKHIKDRLKKKKAKRSKLPVSRTLNLVDEINID